MWQERAACIGSDPELFASGVTSRVLKAKAICADCPVIDQCLTFALDNEDFEVGVYGGLTGDERREIARQVQEFAMS